MGFCEGVPYLHCHKRPQSPYDISPTNILFYTDHMKSFNTQLVVGLIGDTMCTLRVNSSIKSEVIQQTLKYTINAADQSYLNTNIFNILEEAVSHPIRVFYEQL